MVDEEQHGATLAELGVLEAEEATLSSRRRRLHARIDFLRGNGDTTGRLAELLEEERLVSSRRREVHRRLDELRRSLGLETGPPESPRLIGP